MSNVIGWIDLPRAIVLRTNYETAAWYTDARVEAGRYLITESWHYGKKSFTITFPGTVVSAYFASLWGGVPIRSEVPQGDKHGDVGRPHTSTLYFHDDFYFGHVAEEVAKTGFFTLHGKSDAVQCRVHVFGSDAVVTGRSWATNPDSHFQPRTEDMPAHLCGFHTYGKRGHWYTWYGFRPRLALPATTGAR